MQWLRGGISMSEELYHYGTARHSGRYPWGSGNDPQRNKDLLQRINELKSQGVSEAVIAKGMGITTSQLRARRSIAKMQIKQADSLTAMKLKDKGYSTSEVGRKMGINESSVRLLLDPIMQERRQQTKSIANVLKEQLEEKPYLDVGPGIEQQLGVSRTRLKSAIAVLREEDGYGLHYIPVEQLGTGNTTSISVLSKPNTEWIEVYRNKDQISMVTNTHSDDGGRTFLGLKPIANVDSKRIAVKYAEQGGIEKDGIIELRRGVDDISLGSARYAQVRIGVDGTHYLKGMAMYSDDMPKGVDMVFNTNKKLGTPKNKVFKEMKKDKDGNIDTDNPFGATIKLPQKYYTGKDGKKTLSPLNIVNEEGDWDKWSKTLSSQMLSKQPVELAKAQLDLAYKAKKSEYDEIMALTNPVIKRKLLSAFADDADSAAVHLKAAGLPRSGAHVLLPFPGMKPTEIYAPNYKDGEQVVLIRYPHGGIFEIPQLTVNNKYPAANKLIKNAKDAVGINAKVAERLSGADFDGDTAWVIPNNQGRIKTSSALEGLLNFDPKESYPAYKGMTPIKPKTKQQKMGDVSNLISDMTIKGATNPELARAVRHSMVVIDSEKHNLNYKQSFIDNGIGSLKKKYQGSTNGGASTLISRASSEERVNSRKLSINPKTGKKEYTYTNESYYKPGKINKNGDQAAPKLTYKQTKSTKMYETDDAFTLSSGLPMETAYAMHANKLKSLGDKSRKSALAIPNTPYDPKAKARYSKEVASLNAKLNVALKNAPLERQAQLLANKTFSAKKAANPNMEAEEVKKIKGQALAEARIRTGAKKDRVVIEPKEWDAIQAHAISSSKLSSILNNTDLDRVKQLATPKQRTVVSIAKVNKAKGMLSKGYSQAEVASALGISVNALKTAME